MPQIPSTNDRNQLSLTALLLQSLREPEHTQGGPTFKEIAGQLAQVAERARAGRDNDRDDLAIGAPEGAIKPHDVAPARKDTAARVDPREKPRDPAPKNPGRPDEPRAQKPNGPPAETPRGEQPPAADRTAGPRPEAVPQDRPTQPAAATPAGNSQPQVIVPNTIAEIAMQQIEQTPDFQPTAILSEEISGPRILTVAAAALAESAAAPAASSLDVGDAPARPADATPRAAGPVLPIASEVEIAPPQEAGENDAARAATAHLSRKGIEALTRIVRSMLSETSDEAAAENGQKTAVPAAPERPESPAREKAAARPQAARLPQSGAEFRPVTAAAQPAGNAAVASDGDAEPVTARNTAAPKAAAPGSNQNAPDVSRSPVPARTEAVRPSAAADMTQRIERAREIVQRAVSGIVRLGTSGGGRTVIHLHPEHLGRIRLEVNVEKSVASAHLVAENTGVRTLLLHEIATLKDALAQHGIELAQFDVHDGQSHRDASAYDRGQNHGTREKPATAAAKGPAADTIPATPAARHGDGLISVVI